MGCRSPVYQNLQRYWSHQGRYTWPDKPSIVILRMTGPQRIEVAGPAFSAVDLEPQEQRYPTLKACVGDAHLSSNPLHLCVRVMVTDSRSGKTALIWQSGKLRRYTLNSCQQWVRDLVPGAAHYLRTAGWTQLHHEPRKGPFLFSGAAEEEKKKEINSYFGLGLYTLPGQEGVEEKEKKYVAASVPGYHSTLGEMHFNVPEAETVATFLRSLLE